MLLNLCLLHYFGATIMVFSVCVNHTEQLLY